MGYLDYWSGLLTLGESYYDVNAVVNSSVSNILSQINEDKLTSMLIMSLRNNATVKCDFEKDSRPCKPFKQPCLFHIVKDPCEQVNLNYKPSSKMKKFVQAKIDFFERSLESFRKSASQPRNVRSTKNANPSLYNNTWVSWEDQNI